jgi:hypothetical protein
MVPVTPKHEIALNLNLKDIRKPSLKYLTVIQKTGQKTNMGYR